jgi:uncharacterized protein YndB with AHSA1/START domain
MKNNLTAKAETSVNAPVSKVWNALVDPAIIKKYMFGTTVISRWTRGSSIKWEGEWNGKSYEDKGEILEFEPEKKLSYTHFSPLAGQPDIPENYHTVTIQLVPKDGLTFVSLTQDKNKTEEEKEHSQKNWTMMLEGLKKLLEEKNS